MRPPMIPDGGMWSPPCLLARAQVSGMAVVPSFLSVCRSPLLGCRLEINLPVFFVVRIFMIIFAHYERKVCDSEWSFGIRCLRNAK